MSLPTAGRTSSLAGLPDGRALHALRWGGGPHPPLAVLHGLGEDARGWARVCRAAGSPAVAFDLPGFGFSDPPARPTLDAYLDDVLRGLDAFVPGPMVLVGHAVGGELAARAAEHLGDRVKGLFLVAPTGFGRTALDRVVAAPPSEAAGLLAQAARRAGISRQALSRRRLRYDGPVTALWGSRDRLVPADHAVGVVRALPRADVRHWRDVGHHPHHEHPAAFLRLLASVTGAAARTAAAAEPVALAG